MDKDDKDIDNVPVSSITVRWILDKTRPEKDKDEKADIDRQEKIILF
jgi:hypothetical protein